MRWPKKKSDRLTFNEIVEKMGRIWVPKFIRMSGLKLPNLPLWLRMPFKSFNFILFHYLYLIIMTIIGSLILYPGGTLGYTDSLFFAAGAATQSGLNTYVHSFS
jgi:hypothetical protein